MGIKIILPHKTVVGPEDPSIADEAGYVNGLFLVTIREHGQYRPNNLLAHDSSCIICHIWYFVICASSRKL